MTIPAGGQPLIGYRIQRSLRFNNAEVAQLTRTFGAPTDRNKWTLSMWVKRVGFGGTPSLFGTDVNNFFGFSASGSLTSIIGGAVHCDSVNISLLRDPAAWMHFWTYYGGSAQGSYIYINNQPIASAAEVDNSCPLNTAIAHYIGGLYIFDGYLADVIFVDGQVLNPGFFAETDPVTGAWVPKKYAGTFGNNGFWLNFADNSSAAALGTDISGRGNHWTPASISATTDSDSFVDSPTRYGADNGYGGEVRGNYCVMSRLDPGPYDIPKSNGKLDLTVAAGTPANPFGSRGTFWMSVGSGKWYFEYACTARELSAGDWQMVGVLGELVQYPNGGNRAGDYSNGWAYSCNGTKRNNSVDAAYGATWTNGDVIGVAVDMIACTITFYKNGVSQGVAYSNVVVVVTPIVDMYRHGITTQTGTLNFGARPFTYPAPAGHKALCTTNLLDPPIKRGDDYFTTNIRTGTGAAFNVIGKRFQPDLVWQRTRNASDFYLYDSARGATKELNHPTLAHETTQATGVTSFNADGFSAGSRHSFSGSPFVDWLLKRGVVPGFDIVTYTGNGAVRTIAHGLGAVPQVMIVKERSAAGTYHWYVYHAVHGPTKYLVLSLDSPVGTDPNLWNNTAPTSTVFTLGTNVGVNENGGQFLAYLFAEVPGFSKFGFYYGNGSLDGPHVYCGFRPAWLMIKRTDIAMNWSLTDIARNADKSRLGNPEIWYVFANLTIAEATQAAHGDIDFVANGFKVREDGVAYNVANAFHVFMAFAESPFKYACAR